MENQHLQRKSTRISSKPLKKWGKDGACAADEKDEPTPPTPAISKPAKKKKNVFSPSNLKLNHNTSYDMTRKLVIPPSQPQVMGADDEQTRPDEVQLAEEILFPEQTDPVVFLNRDEETTENENPELAADVDIVEITDATTGDTTTTTVGAIRFGVEKPQPALPGFVAVNVTPNKDYNHIPAADFTQLTHKIYEDTIKWRKNTFLLPSGKAGKDFINLLTKWITHFNLDDGFQGLAMKVVMILPNLLLQKPSAKSKTRDHTKALELRLAMWNEGKILDIWKECCVIQKKMKPITTRSAEDFTRIFCNLIWSGKVGPALKFLEANSDNAVLKPTTAVVEKLRELHPVAGPILPNALIEGPLQPSPAAYFNSITEQEILKAASLTNGSGGPSLMDAKQWKRIICSGQFKNENKDLREQLAKFARKISTEIVDPDTLEAYVACRLIPLNKDPESLELQVRPIGVGEVLRRIVGKTISWALSEEIQKAAGPLQVSSGLKAGAEAAIHSMKEIFDDENTDAVILVDAANAFNRLNRLTALHNIQYICPPFATVLINTYRNPARLFIMNGGEIESSEGTTQGDTLAMAFYALGTNPILQRLQDDVPEVAQVWLADDATGAGKLPALLKWWNQVKEEGIKFGYFVKPSKSWLVLKDVSKLEETQKL